MPALLYHNPRLYIEFSDRGTLAKLLDQLKASPLKSLLEVFIWHGIESLLLA